MAIRIRQIGNTVVALCAAKTNPEVGDIYLDDNIHHALSTKFAVDFKSEGFLSNDLADKRIKNFMLAVENETIWERKNDY